MSSDCEEKEPVLLFDGVCNLCNGFINFIIDRDSDGHFTFGALQSAEAEPYLEASGIDPDVIDSMVLIVDGEVYVRSTAFLQVMRRLPFPWFLLSVFIIVPRSLRDFVYQKVAANRYVWFGKRTQCRAPTPERQTRFMSTSNSAE